MAARSIHWFEGRNTKRWSGGETRRTQDNRANHRLKQTALARVVSQNVWSRGKWLQSPQITRRSQVMRSQHPQPPPPRNFHDTQTTGTEQHHLRIINLNTTNQISFLLRDDCVVRIDIDSFLHHSTDFKSKLGQLIPQLCGRTFVRVLTRDQ